MEEEVKVTNYNGYYKVETGRGPTSVMYSVGTTVSIHGRFNNNLVSYLIDNDGSIRNTDSKTYKACIRWRTAIASVRNSPVLMNVAIEREDSN
jgi:hypothetical protein